MFNVATIVCAFALIPVMPRFGLHPIVAIAIGTLLGGAGQVVAQWIQLHREGFRYQSIISFRDPQVRRILLLMAPATIGLAATQVNLAVNTSLATSEGTGAVSYLNYAFRLMYLPIGLFGVSVATAVTPMIARHATSADLSAMRSTISSGLRLMLMLTVPATAGLVVLGAPIVSVIFERKAFTPADTAATAAALMFYAPGLVGYSAVKIAAPAFYSLGNSRTPAIVSVLSMVVNIALNLVLVRLLGFRGLALGTALAALFNATTLLCLLRARLGGLDGGRLGVAVVKIAAASAVMSAAAWGAHAWLASLWPGAPFLVRAAQLFSSIGIALVALAAAAVALRIKEFSDAVQLVTRRIRPRERRTANG
jgi:putative peptidoglycan lipid II flippase